MCFKCTDCFVVFVFLHNRGPNVAPMTPVMWASASSHMFSINIEKQNTENKADQNTIRGGRCKKKKLSEKVQSSWNGGEMCADIGFN